MADNKKSFLLYCDLIHTISKMPNEKTGELFKHILEYVNDNNPKTDDLIIQLTFEPIKQSLKRDLEKYERMRAKNSENAKMRWDKENATASDRMPPDAKNADNGIDSVSDSVKDKGNTNVFNFKTSLLKLCDNKKVVDDWLLVRKNKKATNSETAFNLFKAEVERAKMSWESVLLKCIEKNWIGFKIEWLNNSQLNNNQQEDKTKYVTD